MAQHNDNFRREDCIWLNEKDDIVGRLERIELSTAQIPVIVAGVAKINGTVASHEQRISTNTIALAILKDHDKNNFSTKQVIFTSLLTLAGGALLLLFKALI